mgnify:CR=1 FL=1
MTTQAPRSISWVTTTKPKPNNSNNALGDGVHLCGSEDDSDDIELFSVLLHYQSKKGGEDGVLGV